MSELTRDDVRTMALECARELLRQMHRCVIKKVDGERREALSVARNLRDLYAAHHLTFEEMHTTRATINHKILYLVASNEDEVRACGFLDPTIGVAPAPTT